MKVADVFSTSVRTCGPESNVAEAGWLMWENDCGFVPVVDPAGRVVGVITDRDICIAAATKPLTASQIRVADVMSRAVFCCRPNDSLAQALKTMEERAVRRLPVVNERGEIRGVLSLADLILAARDDGKPNSVTSEKVMRALAAVSRPRKPAEGAESAAQRGRVKIVSS